MADDVNRWGETREQALARRRAQGVMVGLLKSDMYERVEDGDPDVMTWKSPLGLRVRISAPGPRVQISTADGKLLADYVDADGYGLDRWLP